MTSMLGRRPVDQRVLVRPVRAAERREPVPQRQEQAVALGQLVRVLRLERGELLLVAAAAALELLDSRLVLRHRARGVLRRALQVLVLELVGFARLALAFEELGETAGLEAGVFEEGFAVAEEAVFFGGDVARAFELDEGFFELFLELGHGLCIVSV